MSEANKNNIPFRIVRGLESSILNIPFTDGYVYVAIDSKRIYMDTYLNGVQQNKLPIGGGNSGIYYANKTFVDSADLSFSLDDIDGNELPSINDVIINYKSANKTRDGFYRVKSINSQANTVNTEYLPVGGGTGTGPSNTGKVIITPITASNGTTTLEQGYKIDYSVEAYNNANAPIITSGKATFTINGVQVDGGTVAHGGTYSFDVTPYLSTVLETNTIYLEVSINTGGIVNDIVSYTWMVKCIDLRLTWNWDYGYAKYIKEDTFILNWTVSGGVNCTTHISVDDGTDLNINYFKVDLTAQETEGSKSIASFPYGAHRVKMWVTTPEVDIPIKPIEHILTFIQGSSTTPILTVPYFNTKASQYETVRIPFLVYKPDTEKVKVAFYVDNVEILRGDYDVITNSPHYWPYTFGRAGDVKLKIAIVGTEIDFETSLQVTPLDLGIQEPSEGKTFALKASEISGNIQLQQNPKLIFSDNFDWINGGLQTEVDSDGNLNNYICVRQGTTMTIDYKLFENSQVGAQGKTFKFCFKAVNCYSYDAPVLQCYEDSTRLGLKFDAQQALFSSSANAGFTTQYCEGSYIELETEIWPNQADKDQKRLGDRFLMFWVDGVPAAVTTFSNSADSPFIQNVPKTIIIGSTQCDVYVYLVKIYERKLSIMEHLNNFILDAPNVTEMLARFNRNDILGPNGDISYSKLVAKNPGCHAYLYKLTENGMTTGTKDELGDARSCDYTEYYLNADKPYITAKNATIVAQGTSSAAYGVAAFNIRTDFGDTIMYDENGNEMKGRKVSESSIPVDFTCTKVNVASCECANNALNQEWYNMYQPYHDGHRRKSTPDKQYRDCMEFDFGVVFIEDHNNNTSYYNDNNVPDASLYTSTNVFAYNNNGELDTKYMNNKYYKQYAVANMGNDKKNRSIFHDQKNDKVCCVEVADNQGKGYWMTEKVDYNTNSAWDLVFKTDENPNGVYEFRYSVEKTKADPVTVTLEQQKKAFLDFVNWMASCDPSPKDEISHPNGYTNALLPEPKTYGKKTFAGFNPPGYDDTTSTGISLKGFTIGTYEGTYTHDTKEYRIAKMLDECEEHLVMDSVVYHYLFIQRHTMVDNVAKNTFWSTEDLIHWDLTKNYDNDTSDGNDNSGYLKHSYGIEIMDTKQGTPIFNASDSVWLNFIHNIPEVQEYLYGKLANYKINGAGAWDAGAYLKLFKEKQALIPERCWIEDYFRKYIRPRRLGLDGSSNFLQRLEGGKKTHQRQQYETYQGYYIDSKYCTGSSFKDTGSFDMRLNKGPAQYELTEDISPQPGVTYFEKKMIIDSVSGVEYEDYVKVTDLDGVNPAEKGYYISTAGGWTKTEIFPTSYYINLYPSAKIGGQLWRSPTRVLRGQTANIPVGQLLDSPTDATCYIYAANMIQTIGGISTTYPNYIGVSAALKLRELEAGSDSSGYYNNKLNSASLSTNTQLEKAQLQNVGSEKLTGLDLSNLVMLKELKIDGSSFPTLTLAKGCIIHTLYLNALTELRLVELSKLQDFKYDNDLMEKLRTILIQDCVTTYKLTTDTEIKSKQYFRKDNANYILVSDLSAITNPRADGLYEIAVDLNRFGYDIAMANKITKYCFTGIDWKIPSSDITVAANGDGEIQVLQKLLSGDKTFAGVTSQALALTGTLTVDLSGITNRLNEYSIYEKYKKAFPNLNIVYINTTEDNFQPAITIQFYNDYNINTNTYNDLLYEVKSNGQKTLNWLVSDAGPTGENLGEPAKDSDKIYDYSWSGEWKYLDTSGNWQHITNDGFNDITPNGNLKFAAVYNSSKHLYKITLREYDGTDIDFTPTIQPFYEANITQDIPFYRFRYHDTPGMRYEFKGWISAKDYLGNVSKPSIINNFIVENDATYYAFYEEQNCITTASRMDYFEFDAYGSKISLKPQYRYLIQEPITLPLKNNNISITSIGNFGVYQLSGTDTIKIPEIYFLNNGNGGAYSQIAGYAFWSAAQGTSSGGRVLLKNLYLPTTITTIGEHAFEGCHNLEIIQLPNALENNIGITNIGTYAFNSTGKIIISEVPGSYEPFAKLNELGVSAFYKAGPNVHITKIPQLKSIPGYAFGYCDRVVITDFSNVNIMNANALKEANKYESINIILPTNLDGFAKDCFLDYSKGKINTVTYHGGGSVSNETLAYLGLSASNPITIEQVIDE